jgi:hypothetical protein
VNDRAGSYEEWRVTGQPGGGYPPYEFVWSRRLRPAAEDDPEAAARRFIEVVGPESWAGGPYLSRRTVVISDWTEERVSLPGTATDPR